MTCVLSRKVINELGGSFEKSPLLSQYNYGYKGLKNQVFICLDEVYARGLHLQEARDCFSTH